MEPKALVNRARGRITEKREPIVDGGSRQARVSRGSFMTSPAPRAQIVVSAEEFEEILRHALMDVEVGAKCRVKAFNHARGAVTIGPAAP